MTYFWVYSFIGIFLYYWNIYQSQNELNNEKCKMKTREESG